jgi:hypothetical protein
MSQEEEMKRLENWLFNFQIKFGKLRGKEIINTVKGDYVRIVRFADEGFNIERYGSTYYQVGKFINVILGFEERLFSVEKDIQENTFQKPKGCFAHFYKFDLETAKNGILFFRKNDKVNVAYLPIEQKIFVRNVTDSLKSKYIIRQTFKIEDTKAVLKEFWDETNDHDWVIMSLREAIKRTDSHINNFVREASSTQEIITETYLTEEQINKLVF